MVISLAVIIYSIFGIFIGSKASVKLSKIIGSPFLFTDVKKLSSDFQTSNIEAFHSVVNHFAPKMFSFTFEGIGCR